MYGESRQHVAEVDPRIMPVEPGRLHQAHDRGLAYVMEKGGCYLSPHTKLADQAKSALLLDERSAEAFADAVAPVLRKLHGEQVRLVVERWESSPSGVELASLLAPGTT